MEGLGLGTTSSASLLTSASTAILAHKALAAFALGSALRQSNMAAGRIAALAGVFALGTPAGIAFGMYASSSLKGPGEAICTALAAGTFMQVSMMEIIPSSLQPAKGDTPASRALRLATLLLGFGIMTGIIFVIE